MSDPTAPEAVTKVLGDDARYCASCGGWHHRLYHQPVPLAPEDEVVVRNGLVIEPLESDGTDGARHE